MNITRKIKRRVQAGGYVVNGLEIININDYINKESLIEFDVAGLHPGFRSDNVLKSGSLLNTSCCYHVYGDKGYLVGVSRFMNRRPGTEDIRTNTTIVDRHPMSDNHPWGYQWGSQIQGPDVPLLYIYDLTSKQMKFFRMHYSSVANNTLYKESAHHPYDVGVPLTNGIMENNFMLEDPRVAKIFMKDKKDIFLFTAHTSGYNVVDIPGGYGTDLSPDLNIGKKKENFPKYWQIPYVSWCYTSEVDDFINTYFLGVANPALSKNIPNKRWHPLCANYLNNNTDKNWVVVPRTDEKGKVVFDFIQSFGIFSQGVVVLRYDVAKLIRNVIKGDKKTGIYDSDAHSKCEYIQTLDGKTKDSGKATTINPMYDLKSKSKITVMESIMKRWLNTLVYAFVYSLPNGTTNVESAGFIITKNEAGIKFRYPFKTEAKEIKTEDIDNLKVGFWGGISTGGPVCKINTKDNNERLGVGHFKPNHCTIYLAMVAALFYKKTESNFASIIAKIQMPPEEKMHFLKFIEFMTGPMNIFRYIYSYILQIKPYHPKHYDATLAVEKGFYNNKQCVHRDLFYCSFIFKVNIGNYDLLSVSSQIFFDNHPKDCIGPSLQFASTITGDEQNNYYIGYGEMDAVGRIAIIPTDKMHTFLEDTSKYMNVDKTDDDYEFYLDLMKHFLTLKIIVKP